MDTRSGELGNNNYSLEIQTVQSSTIKVLIEALKEILTDTVIEIIKYYRASVVHMCRINIFCKLPKGFRRMPHVTLYSTRARCFAIPF